MTSLNEDEYLATMGSTRDRLDQDAELVSADLGAYLRTVDSSDCRGFDFSDRVVADVMSMDNGRWQHVLLAADAPNVYLVIVLDGSVQRVHGHHLLDLNKLYGLDG